MQYPKSYHVACNHLIAFGAHNGDTVKGRKLIALALRDLRKVLGRKQATIERRHMIYISGMFPVKGSKVKLSDKQMTCVAALRPGLLFVSDSQDVQAIKDHIGAEAEGYDSFFVATSNGDYTEVWAMCGIVPRLSKLVTRLV